MTDEYSKTGPKSYKATAAQRHNDLMRELRTLLLIKDERLFIEALRAKLGIDSTDTRFLKLITLWREQQRHL